MSDNLFVNDQSTSSTVSGWSFQNNFVANHLQLSTHVYVYRTLPYDALESTPTNPQRTRAEITFREYLQPDHSYADPDVNVGEPCLIDTQ